MVTTLYETSLGVVNFLIGALLEKFRVCGGGGRGVADEEDLAP